MSDNEQTGRRGDGVSESPLQDRSIRVATAEWVAANMDHEPHLFVSLTKEPNREDWFAIVLPALDYEIHGGTWDDPLWAWMTHPWFAALNLTADECAIYLQGEGE